MNRNGASAAEDTVDEAEVTAAVEEAAATEEADVAVTAIDGETIINEEDTEKRK
jgi:hypothetical protein